MNVFWAITEPSILPRLKEMMNTYRRDNVWVGEHYFLGIYYLGASMYTPHGDEAFKQLEQKLRYPRCSTTLEIEDYVYAYNRVKGFGKIYEREVIRGIHQLSMAWWRQKLLGL